MLRSVGGTVGTLVVILLSTATAVGVAGGDGEIPDPVLEGADFEETFARVEACVEVIVGLLSE